MIDCVSTLFSFFKASLEFKKKIASQKGKRRAIEVSIIIVFECVAGILVSVKTRAHQQIHKLKESYDHLVKRVTDLQERSDKLVLTSSY